VESGRGGRRGEEERGRFGYVGLVLTMVSIG
jgi:hypothetical protein